MDLAHFLDDHQGEEDRIVSLQKHFEIKLRHLQKNEADEFWIREQGYESDDDFESFADESQGTARQWKTLFTELLRNTSVETVDVELKCCPTESLSLLVDYIRTSPKLGKLVLHYNYQDYPILSNSPEMSIPENYRSKIDDILRAARQNPYIKHLGLHCLGNPQSIQDLLAGNASLTTFDLTSYDPPNAFARAIALGFKSNIALTHIDLEVHNGDVDIMVSGLCHDNRDRARAADDDDAVLPSSRLESLSLRTHRNPELVLQVIQSNPSLNKLSLYGGGSVEFILKNLHHPKCAGLKTLELYFVTIGANHDNEQDTMTTTTTTTTTDDWSVPNDQVNKTIESMCLHNVHFARTDMMNLLWHVGGLKQLEINNYRMGRPVVGENNRDYWAEYIQFSSQLCKLCVEAYDPHERAEAVSRIMVSILKGARGHGALEYLSLKSGTRKTVVIPGGQLTSLLQGLLEEATCLKELDVCHLLPEAEFAAGVAGGLGKNESLQELLLNVAMMDAAIFRMILEGLLDNDTLQHFESNTSRYSLTYAEQVASQSGLEICDTLSRLFQQNKSQLRHITMPRLDLRGLMNHLLQNSSNTSALKSLDLRFCQTDVPSLNVFGNALVNEKNYSLDIIRLPRIFRDDNATRVSTAMVKGFVENVSRMSRIKMIDFDHYFDIQYLEPNDGADFFKLLFDTARENKNLHSVGLVESLGSNFVGPFVSEINYYLKLNRFGRHVLDTRGLRRSLWPAILARMTSKAENADALFYFIREYFMRNSYPLRQQEPQCSRPTKRSKLEEQDSSGKKSACIIT